MKVIVANIGNTNTQLAVAENRELRCVETIRTSALRARQLPPLLQNERNIPIIAACVVPDVRKWFAREMLPVHWVGPEMPTGLDLSLVDASTLGGDRLANGVAALEHKLPAIVVDCGTAITIEVVDCQGCFRGGSIMPGRFLARQALHDYTGELPIVEMAGDLPSALGTNTAGAIQAGVDLGLLGALERTLNQTQQELGQAATIIAVGGDREFFVAHLEGIQCGPETFTLRGLLLIGEQLPLQ